jgi:hypothetical protein
MFPGVLDSQQARPLRGSSSSSSPSFSPCISQSHIQVQKVEDQLRQTQEMLAQERAANKVKDYYMVVHMAWMERAMMVRIHNTTHPFCFSNIYVQTLCNYMH